MPKTMSTKFDNAKLEQPMLNDSYTVPKNNQIQCIMEVSNILEQFKKQF